MFDKPINKLLTATILNEEKERRATKRSEEIGRNNEEGEWK